MTEPPLTGHKLYEKYLAKRYKMMPEGSNTEPLNSVGHYPTALLGKNARQNGKCNVTEGACIFSILHKLPYELYHKKVGLQGFCLGPTQTSLYIHRLQLLCNCYTADLCLFSNYIKASFLLMCIV